MISETVFEARFSQAEGLCRMGADIRIEGRRASVFGVERLFGAEVFARDLRCGAALLCAALAAEGESLVHGAEYVERGYEKIETALSLLGGEPFEPENQPGLLELSRRIKAAYPEKSIWSFTGYLFDRDILAKKLGPWKVTQELLSYLDVLVDGPFVASLKNLNLRFRGSSNQRLIDVPASLKTGAVVLWDERQ